MELQLQRQVYIYNRPKTINDAIYQNVDTIHDAIRANRQVTFRYLEWTMKKQLATASLNYNGNIVGYTYYQNCPMFFQPR